MIDPRREVKSKECRISTQETNVCNLAGILCIKKLLGQHGFDHAQVTESMSAQPTIHESARGRVSAVFTVSVTLDEEGDVKVTETLIMREIGNVLKPRNFSLV